MNGLVSIIKPPGISSHDVVAKARRILNTRKIGHSGTLDPGAAGVLVLGVGQGTKLLEYVQNSRKIYRAEILLGKETDSGDMFGELLGECEVKDFNAQQWQSILNEFLGTQEQIPPMTSALKKDGVRLYTLARKGLVVERATRLVEIHAINLVKILNQRIIFDVECSSGTYIRVLCQDIAKKAGSCGVMSFLIRKSIGSFELKRSNLLSENIEIKPMIEAVDFMHKIKLDDKQLCDIKHGRFISSREKFEDNENLALINDKGCLVAIAMYSNDLIKPKKVFM